VSPGAVLALALLVAQPAVRASAPADMVRVAGGAWRSSVEPDATPVQVAAFLLDVEPVTNAQYLAFVQAEPRWRRGAVAPLWAEPGYLEAWSTPVAFRPLEARGPVTSVSWFAARAYCAWRHKRLPTTAEWELAAADVDATVVLAWYAEPLPKILPPVGGAANTRGVRDLHGLIWEWVFDFATNVTSSNGAQGRACGGGAQGAADPADAAAFLRFAFRGALEGNHTVRSLGFRCAQDLP
jgi:formylglycine-generating enzyme required for sulfatase activity